MTASATWSRVALIREHVPDAALTTDIIVGFPGESEEDFEQTLQVVAEVGYDSAFTFIFSPRRGTEAAEITDGVVAHPVKVERMGRLVELVQLRARERAQRFVGREVEVLVEGRSRNDPDRLRGRTRHNKVVNFTGLAGPGELTQVQILSATSQTLAGQEQLLARARGCPRLSRQAIAGARGAGAASPAVQTRLRPEALAL